MPVKACARSAPCKLPQGHGVQAALDADGIPERVEERTRTRPRTDTLGRESSLPAPLKPPCCRTGPIRNLLRLTSAAISCVGLGATECTGEPQTGSRQTTVIAEREGGGAGVIGHARSRLTNCPDGGESLGPPHARARRLLNDWTEDRVRTVIVNGRTGAFGPKAGRPRLLLPPPFQPFVGHAPHLGD